MAGMGAVTAGAADMVTERLAGAAGEKLVGAGITARPGNGRKADADCNRTRRPTVKTAGRRALIPFVQDQAQFSWHPLY